jgi:hypothetical protein
LGFQAIRSAPAQPPTPVPQPTAAPVATPLPPQLLIINVQPPTVVVAPPTVILSITQPTAIVNITVAPVAVTVVMTGATTAPAIPSRPARVVRYAPIKLLEPRDGQTLESLAATFEWQSVPLQQPGDHYEVFLREATGTIWQKTFQSADATRLMLPYQQLYRRGMYIWSVFVVDAQGGVVSPEGDTRTLFWRHPTEPDPDCAKCHLN